MIFLIMKNMISPITLLKIIKAQLLSNWKKINGQRKFQIVTVVESTDENVEYIDE